MQKIQLAVYALAGLTSDDGLMEDWIIPSAFDKRVVSAVAAAVAAAAREEGIARV